MRNGYEKLLRTLEQTRLPEGLYRDVLGRITRAQLRRARTHLVLFCGSALASLAAIIPAVQYSAGEFSRSNFAQYLSLSFSDGAALLAHWKELSLSLVESIPPVGITLVLASCLVLLFSLRLIARYASGIRLTTLHPVRA